MRVLIVEDEKPFAKELSEFLEKEEHLCDIAHTGKQGADLLVLNSYDFVLLDIGLPDYNGLDLIKEGKKYEQDPAFIVITARGELEDKLKGFDMGADDYIAKPFSPLELLSRIHAICRRKFGHKENSVRFGKFVLELSANTLFYENTPVELTSKESALIRYFALNKNRVLNRLQLTEHIWGDFFEDDYDSNFIDVHIKNLRRKLAKYDPQKWIVTIRNMGYKLNVPLE